jgi:hypothetical protein
VRRPAVLLSIALLAGALLAWRRRRAARAPLGASPPATALAPAAPGTRFVSVPWELIAAPTEEPSLTIRYRSDARMELDRIDAQETPTQVFVTALMRWHPPAGGGFALAHEHEAVVSLGRPLGERELVHAPVDEPSAPPLYP